MKIFDNRFAIFLCILVVSSGCSTSTKSDSSLLLPQVSRIPFAESPDEFSCAGFEIAEVPDYDWSDYSKKMVAKIRKHWQIPIEARAGAKGSVKVHFIISLDGALACMEFQKRSDHRNLDIAAWNAVAGSQPFPPLPADAPVILGEAVTINFSYNSRGPTDDGVQFSGGVRSGPGG